MGTARCAAGTTCPVVATARNSDYLLLVTEPTPFGLHDLRLAVEVAHTLEIPAGVVVNRENGPYQPLDDFCEENHLPVLIRIPDERIIAEESPKERPWWKSTRGPAPFFRR